MEAGSSPVHISVGAVVSEGGKICSISVDVRFAALDLVSIDGFVFSPAEVVVFPSLVNL